MQKLKKVKITVIKTEYNKELAKEYAVPDYPPCLIHSVGQVFYSNGQKPKGFCDYAWNSVRDYVMPIALHSGYIFGEGGWLKHKDMAIITCSDGIKPVTVKPHTTKVACVRLF